MVIKIELFGVGKKTYGFHLPLKSPQLGFSHTARSFRSESAGGKTLPRY